jgi:hypothetical protein
MSNINEYANTRNSIVAKIIEENPYVEEEFDLSKLTDEQIVDFGKTLARLKEFDIKSEESLRRTKIELGIK